MSKAKPVVYVDRRGLVAWQVTLKVQHQQFLIGPLWDSKAEAQWYAKQLRTALKKL